MRNEEQNSVEGRDPDATVVKPFFNEAAEETARPVVPLGQPQYGQPSDHAGAHDRLVVPVASYADSHNAGARRTSAWPLALVVISLLTGLVVGIAGLRLYQRNSTTAAQPATPDADATEQTSAVPDSTQGETTPAVVEQPSDPAVAEQTADTVAVAPAASDDSAPAAREEVNSPTDAPAEARRTDDGDAARRETAETAPARAPREEVRVDDDEDDDRGRRGRGDDDDDERRGPRMRPDGVYDTQGPSPEGSAAERRAEREEQRLRRAERQRRREERRQRRGQRGEGESVDSVRGIFEGRPPR